MKKIISRISVWFVIAFLQFSFTGCVMSQTMVNHSFSFNTGYDSPNVEVLDFEYGNSKQFGTRAVREEVQLGQVFGQWGVNGLMPRGEFLYVKWRYKNNGEIHEDRVDLTKILPKNIDNCGIHFVIKGSQLYIYLIPPPGVWPGSGFARSANDPVAADYFKKHQIYPN